MKMIPDIFDPKQEVEKAIVDINTTLFCYDNTNASGYGEFEEFWNLVPTTRAKQ